jgi:hypothetical protein
MDPLLSLKYEEDVRMLKLAPGARSCGSWLHGRNVKLDSPMGDTGVLLIMIFLVDNETHSNLTTLVLVVGAVVEAPHNNVV